MPARVSGERYFYFMLFELQKRKARTEKKSSFYEKNKKNVAGRLPGTFACESKRIPGAVRMNGV